MSTHRHQIEVKIETQETQSKPTWKQLQVSRGDCSLQGKNRRSSTSWQPDFNWNPDFVEDFKESSPVKSLGSSDRLLVWWRFPVSIGTFCYLPRSFLNNLLAPNGRGKGRRPCIEKITSTVNVRKHEQVAAWKQSSATWKEPLLA